MNCLKNTMGLFSFLRKTNKDARETEHVKDQITFSGIEDFINAKSYEIKIKEDSEIFLIREKIKLFVNELNEKIIFVKNFDVEAKKADDRIKYATNEGRKKYIEFLEKFIGALENAEKDTLEKNIEEINNAFLHFNENSRTSYERATLLIGKEMASIKDTIKKFSRELVEIFEENKNIVSTSRKISFIRERVHQIEEMNKTFAEINSEIDSFPNEIHNKEEDSRKLSEKIKNITRSREYIENIERERILHELENEPEKEIQELRQLIDFKALASFFHIFEDKMKLVKDYRDNFAEEFRRDKGIGLLNLLNESKLNNESIYSKMNQVIALEGKIKRLKGEIKPDETKALSSELERISAEIKNLINEKDWAEKRRENLKTDYNEIVKSIEDELSTMGMKLDWVQM